MPPKRHLTKQQSKRTSQNNRKKLNAREVKVDDSQLGEPTEAQVIRHMKYQIDVLTKNGEQLKCHYRQNLGALVCGDKVIVQPHIGLSTGIITAMHERTTLLTRPGRYTDKKLVAANIEKIFIVVAPKPEVSDIFIDRYLVAAEHFGFTPILILNKIDLLPRPDAMDQRLEHFETVGYQTLKISVKEDIGLTDLKKEFKETTGILVGQSGVGKSSLINYLLPDANLDTSPLSDISGLGQHTTSAAKLFQLASGGQLIDSPGVREFGLNITKEQLAEGFVEFRPYLGQCKFRDCQHLGDKHCAIKSAVNEGQISDSRYQSYSSIYQSL